MTQPIDYARAESADVVRKKHRRRVVWFVVATVVVMVIGWLWISSRGWPPLSLLKMDSLGSVASYPGRLALNGPTRAVPSGISTWVTANPHYTYRNSVVGIDVYVLRAPGHPRWIAYVRYRTLFTLAMIPWIITLIHLIRSWRRKHRTR